MAFKTYNVGMDFQIFLPKFEVSVFLLMAYCFLKICVLDHWETKNVCRECLGIVFIEEEEEDWFAGYIICVTWNKVNSLMH